MESKHAIVIDELGFKIEFVLVEFYKEGEEIFEKPVSYILREGENLIYKDVSIALSMSNPHWTGFEWEETGTVEITPDMVVQLRESKLQEINAACQQTIYAGINVETADGLKHFSLTEHDQTEILGLTAQVKEGALPAIPYHADGELCKLWSVEDFTNIAEKAQAHIFYHRTYCNHLRAYIKHIDDYELLKQAFYGMPLPDDLAASMNALIGGTLNA